MPDVPIPVDLIDDDTLKRQAAMIPVPMRNATGILPQQPRGIPTDTPPMPVIPAGRAIPSVGAETPQMPSLAPKGKPIPMGRVPGIEGTIDPNTEQYNTPPPNQPGVASLWAKAENIHNPILRVLGEIGAGGARALDTVGAIAAPRITGAIPGTSVNEDIKVARQNAEENREIGNEAKEAGTAHTEAETGAIPARVGLEKAQTEAIEYPQPKQGLTPEETTIHDLMAGGENGQPRINPQTQQPYSYLDAYQAVKQAGQDVKPEPERKTTKVTRVIGGVPHEVLVDAVTGEDVKDEGQTKIPQDNSGKADARADKSYQLQSGRLDKIRQPVEQIIARVGRLNDTLNQNTPQADALIAPELLSIMSGGAGSGLRMNEAEIARIVGGRSAWENLKASMQHWAAKPEDARSITPEQDKQIRSLVGMVHQKLVQKQAVLDSTEEALINSNDPKQHREIVAGARRQLDAIDAAGQENNEPQRPANVPQDYVFNQNGPKGAGWYKPTAAK